VIQQIEAITRKGRGGGRREKKGREENEGGRGGEGINLGLLQTYAST